MSAFVRLMLLFVLAVIQFSVSGCHNIAASNISSPDGIICHSHNDYHHDRPLFDAIDNGFRSVEADIFLVDGKLLVGHSKSELKAGRTLETLYLDHLKEMIAENGGAVYGDGKEFFLMIDIKTDGKNVYKVLDGVLESYGEMVSSDCGGKYTRRALTVIISGDRPWDDIVADGTRYVGLDGRVKDLDSELGADVLPLISDDWTDHFEWDGKGDILADELAKLRAMVTKAHAGGRRIRFWALPNKTGEQRHNVWKTLIDAGVDYVGADNLSDLAEFVRKVE